MYTVNDTLISEIFDKLIIRYIILIYSQGKTLRIPNIIVVESVISVEC